MRRLIGLVLLSAMLVAVAACKNTGMNGGAGSNGGGGGTIHAGIPF
jgi:predicted small secreted protein